MDGNQQNGVSLTSGSSSYTSGSIINLSSGTRQWRFRVVPSSESEMNSLVVEYKDGNSWIFAQQFVVAS
jgi:hypothetical protein